MINAADFIKWLEVFNVYYGPGASTGTVDPGLINEIAYYAAAGDTVSGLTTANNGILSTDGSGVPAINNTVDLVGQLNVDNLRLDGNTLSSTDTNGNIVFTPNGTGKVNITNDAIINTIPFGFGLSGETSGFIIGSTGRAAATGANNFSIGDSNVLTSLTSGDDNVSMGANNFGSLAGGNRNLCFGTNAGGNLTSGGDNIGIGTNACEDITSGTGNVAIGTSAGSRIIITNESTSIGRLSSRANPTGGSNVTSAAGATWVGARSTSNSTTSTGTLALGAYAIVDVATGSTSGDDGPGIAIGSVDYPVGFRGDTTLYPSAGASAGYWKVKINGTAYKIELLAIS